MKNNQQKPSPHPELIDTLFAFKSNTSPIFKDVLGIHNISHIAVTRIDADQNILIFSSTPAMEFNLFTSDLWQFDNTYNPEWFTLCTWSSWDALYEATHYDALHHSRQIKHHITAGMSLAINENDTHYIYSIANTLPMPQSIEILTNHINDFYKIGQYCKNLLHPYFLKANISEQTSIE